ncbi:MAG: hypothetical protein GXO37_05435 [Chloroflexi bacterium]|nr:hypothetical protein [Chloroflexota bacterium]
MSDAPASARWRPLLALAALFLAVFFGWRGLTAPDPAPPLAPPVESYSTRAPTSVAGPDAPVEHYQGRAWDLYFTRPEHPAARSKRGGPDAYLAQALRTAQDSIAMAIYDLDLWSIRNALLDAYGRGVEVRLVVDEDHITPEVESLRAAGIPVVTDNGAGLMHHKFVVIDAAEVWTGSMNFTVSGAYRNANHLIRIPSRRLAADYLREFDEMFVDGRFGPASRADTPYPQVTVNRVPMEAWFSPDEHPQARLVPLLRSAQEDILLLAYTWTADPLTDALLERAQHGVSVRGWFETEQLDAAGHDYERLRAAGLAVAPDPFPGLLHHKVVVVDGQTVVLGSYNFTRAADVRNDENLLVVHDPDLAAAFYTWWQDHAVGP